MSMYLGGCMTYGETLGLSMNSNPPENFKRASSPLLWLYLVLPVRAFVGTP